MAKATLKSTKLPPLEDVTPIVILGDSFGPPMDKETRDKAAAQRIRTQLSRLADEVHSLGFVNAERVSRMLYDLELEIMHGRDKR